MSIYYQELTLIENECCLIIELWEKLYHQLHISLADVYNQHGIDTIGVSFPQYKYEQKNGKSFAVLGNKLRLFAPDEATLAKLNIEKWLERLTDYVHIKKPAPVPEHRSYVVVKRYRYRPIQQQAKRHAQRHKITYDIALQHCLQHRKKEIFPPFIRMQSHSTSNPYPLVIWQTAVEEEKKGQYNTYGFSVAGSTAPHW